MNNLTRLPIGEAVLKIILVFAELERKLTSERVKDIMIGRANEGKWNGARVPYGWDWDSSAGWPVHSEKEAPFGRAMYEMYLESQPEKSVIITTLIISQRSAAANGLRKPSAIFCVIR